MSARPYTPEELDRLHAAGLSAVGHYNTPRTESDGEIVLGVLAGNDRYLKPAYCAGIRAEAARMEAERSALKALGSETPTPLADELVRLRADLAAANASLATLRSRLNLADGDNLDDALSDLIGHSEWLRGVEAECARILGVEADGDIREAAARCAKERDAANERADKAERERDEARGELDDIDTLLARTDLEGSREDRIGALFNSIGELTAECDTCKATIDGNDRTVHNVMVADLAAALGPGSPLNWTILIEAVKAVEVKRAFLSAEAVRLMAERDNAERERDAAIATSTEALRLVTQNDATLAAAIAKVATLTALVKEAGEALGPMVAMREARESWYDPSELSDPAKLLYRDLSYRSEVTRTLN